MRKFSAIVTFSLIVSVLLAACGPTPPPTLTPTTRPQPSATPAPDTDFVVKVKQPFTLHIGETARLDEHPLVVQVNGVLMDNRCPSDVLCITAGWVEIELELRLDGQPAVQVVISTEQEAMPIIQAAGYYLQLLSVDPYPISTQQIQADEYQVQLRIK